MRVQSAAAISLAECSAATQFAVVRVLAQGAEFLRYLSEQGLVLGAVGEVRANDADAGIVTVRLENRELSLGHSTAESILVETTG
jgi:Fe2+ transport system protein FeoA